MDQRDQTSELMLLYHKDLAAKAPQKLSMNTKVSRFHQCIVNQNEWDMTNHDSDWWVEVIIWLFLLHCKIALDFIQTYML